MIKNPEGKLPVKIIALDLDDTLLQKDLTIGDRTVLALQKAASQGIYIVICSGRSEHGILPFVRRLNIAGSQEGRYIITGNGTGIFDLHSRTEIYSMNVDGEILMHAHEVAVQNGFQSQVYNQTTIFVPEDNDWARRDVELTKMNMEIVPDYKKFLLKGHSKMVIPGDPIVLQKIQAQLKKDFGNKAVVFTSKPFFLEVLPPGAGKGEALLWLSEKLNISRDNTMAFGDSMNDESMIRLSKYGVAMINGLDYIKNVAAFVTEFDNNNDGIGKFIENFVI